MDRTNRLSPGSDVLDLAVNRASQVLNPLVSRIAGDGQVLTHDLDVDAFHRLLPEFQPVEALENLLDSAPHFGAFAFVLFAFEFELL